VDACGDRVGSGVQDADAVRSEPGSSHEHRCAHVVWHLARGVLPRGAPAQADSGRSGPQPGETYR